MARNSYANVAAQRVPVTVIPPVLENQQDESNHNIIETTELQITSNMHPLYLQNIYHPGLILISKKLTGTENFGPWKRSISIALSVKNKLGIVNGTVENQEMIYLLNLNGTE